MPLIVLLEENPHETVNGIRDDTVSRGVDLEGATITAIYNDGSTEFLTWRAFDPYTFGGASGTDIDMSFGSGPHELSTTKLLTSLQIDLQPANSVFDTNLDNDDYPIGNSTPGSKNGYPFRVTPEYEETISELIVTYSGIVNVTGSPAVGDLYTTMVVDFSNLPAGGLLGDLSWDTDIDTMRDAGDLVPYNQDNDTLVGGAGDDTLNGGLGADTLEGGAGDDTYSVDNTGDLVIEAAGSGTDVVRASVSYALPDHVENLVLTGNGHINGTGNALNNRLTGNAGNNIFDGGLGADTLEGGAGDDTYSVDNTGDLVIETANGGTDTTHASVSYALTDHVENLVLTGSSHLNGTGNALNNRLTGNAGNNIFDGGLGADTLEGGVGDDIFSVDNTGDLVIEAANGGTDTVHASVSYTLTDHVENLVMTGGGHLRGTGNGLANLLSGNVGNDVLKGNGGSDRLEGGEGDDRLFGGASADKLKGGVGNDSFDGGGGYDQVIYSGAASGVYVDLEHGLAYGGAGNDTLYQLENVFGSAHGDTIYGSNSHGNRLEGSFGDDVLFGLAGRDVILGDGGSDTIFGGEDVDKIFGGDGDDFIIGGSHTDFLSGGSGADLFIFSTTDDTGVGEWGRDRIRDFDRAERDRIDLSGIDANSSIDGDQQFFDGGGEFNGEAGELIINSYIRSEKNVFISSYDLDGDGLADGQLYVVTDVLDITDFVL